MTVISTELINYSGISGPQIASFVADLVAQGIPEIIIRFNAMYDWSTGPNAGTVAAAKSIITACDAAGIDVSIDLHTWYTTWDNYFRTGASDYEADRLQYLSYIGSAIDAMIGYNVKAWMVLNEPKDRVATPSENQFIKDCIFTGQSHTAAPVSVRFMGGYSPSTGYYSSSIDGLTDFLCRNTYWDPRNPSHSVYGVDDDIMNDMILTAATLGKELWITEFGATNSNEAAQAAYVAAWVTYAKSEGIDAIFCWVSQPLGGGSESYNIFNGFSPRPAFYELDNDPIPATTTTTTSTSTTSTSSTSTSTTNTRSTTTSTSTTSTSTSSTSTSTTSTSTTSTSTTSTSTSTTMTTTTGPPSPTPIGTPVFIDLTTSEPSVSLTVSKPEISLNISSLGISPESSKPEINLIISEPQISIVLEV